MNKEQSLEYLKNHNIEFKLYEHPAVFTTKEAAIHCKNVPGIPVKNLLLKSDKSDFFLVVLPAEKRLDSNKLRKLFGVKKLRFASAEDLMNLMALEPGSVSILGLINDKDAKVTLILDKEAADAEIINFHPNVNTASVTFTKKEFQKFLNTLKQEKIIKEL